MLRLTLIEEAIAARYAEQQMRCPVHLSIGQEAVSVGVCAALNRDDFAMSGHRSHGHYIAKGGDLTRMLAEIYGKSTGCAGGKGGSMHLVDLDCGFLGAVPIVGSTVGIATGVAFAEQRKKSGRVIVAFFGEAVVEAGILHESVNFAILHKLPIVYLCENNLFSVYSPLNVRQPDHLNITELMKAHGMRGYQGDGNNVMEVYKETKNAVAHARKGEGPSFLEFFTYRKREHCGPNFDNHLDYRAGNEYDQWMKKCPLERTAAELKLSPDDYMKLRAPIDAEIETAFATARAAPFPTLDQINTNLWAEAGYVNPYEDRTDYQLQQRTA